MLMKNSQDQELANFQGFLLIVIVFIVGLSVNYTQLAKGFFATDDNLYSYICGLGLFFSDQVNVLQGYFVDYFSQGNATEEFQYRLKLRQNYVDNYVFHSSFQFISARIINPLAGISAEPYPLQITYSMLSGVIIAFLVTFLIVLSGIRYINKFIVTAAFSLALILIGLFDLLPLPFKLDNIMQHSSIWDSVVHSGILMLNTSTQYNLLSFPERTNFYLLSFLIFILRTQNKYSWAYWLVVASSFFHQSQAGLLLALLFSIDISLRPEKLKEKNIILPIIITATLFATRETLWAAIGGVGMVLGLSVIFAGLIFFFLVYFSSFLREKFLLIARTIGGYRDRFVSSTNIYSDAVLILVFWVVTWPIAWAIVQYINHFSTYYFWAGVHGRTWALVSPFLYFCFFHYLLVRLQGKWKAKILGYKAFILILAGVLSVPIVVQAVNLYKDTSVLGRVAERLVMVDKAIEEGSVIRFGNSQSDELAIYYSIAKTIDTGTDWYSRLIPDPEKNPAN